MLGYTAALERFRELAAGPLDALVAGLLKAAEQWAGGRPWEDDLSVVALRCCLAPGQLRSAP